MEWEERREKRIMERKGIRVWLEDQKEEEKRRDRIEEGGPKEKLSR